ncbi:MAG: ABC transporter substrate-binding protein [Chloroflexi bacterium]|nr:ABC transporter substrate-binding protein [Chloroflexota bacterium]
MLFYEGPDPNRLIPMLAKSWTVSTDGLQYVFEIREGVRFHDGTLLDAHAVQYLLKRALQMAQEPSSILRQLIDESSIEVIGNYRLRITLTKPFSGFLHIVALPVASVVSPAAVEAHGGIQPGTENGWMRTHMVGTGPFKLAECDPVHRRITLMRNTDYWRTPAQIERVVIWYVNNIEKRKQMLFQQEADIVFFQASSLQSLSSCPGITIDANPSLDLMVFGLNVQREPLMRKDVRYAISHAFDYDRFLKDIRQGYGLPIHGPVPNGLFGYTTDLPRFERDLSRAYKHLKMSGLPHDSLRPLTITYCEGLEDRKAGCELLRDNLAEIGLKAVIESLDWPVFLEKGRAGQFDIAFLAWAPDYPDPDNYVQTFCHSQGQFASMRFDRLPITA